MKARDLRPSDLQGLAQLATHATAEVTGLVEAVHRAVGSSFGLRGVSERRQTRGISRLVYRCILGVNRIVGRGVDGVLSQVVPRLRAGESTPRRERFLAALNGVMGDTLAATGNPLAISAAFRRQGRALALEPRALGAAFPEAGGRLLVLAHGLCWNDLLWLREGHDHGAALARDLGYSALYLHYNSGLHISTNGRTLASLLEALVSSWPRPVEELVMLGHSVGGLVARSACHYAEAAGHAWPRRLRKLVFLGTPHHGAPLERGGAWLTTLLGSTPFTAPFARLGELRSAGITDLRYGNLVDEDWQGRDRFEETEDTRRVLPLPAGVECYALAATVGKRPGDLRQRLLGDDLVPVDSALGRHADPARCLPFPAERQWIAYQTNHLQLLNRPEVYAQLRQWLDS